VLLCLHVLIQAGQSQAKPDPRQRQVSCHSKGHPTPPTASVSPTNLSIWISYNSALRKSRLRLCGNMEFMANLQSGLDELKPSLFGTCSKIGIAMMILIDFRDSVRAAVIISIIAIPSLCSRCRYPPPSAIPHSCAQQLRRALRVTHASCGTILPPHIWR
jgi:hypothetical protein